MRTLVAAGMTAAMALSGVGPATTARVQETPGAPDTAGSGGPALPAGDHGDKRGHRGYAGGPAHLPVVDDRPPPLSRPAAVVPVAGPEAGSASSPVQTTVLTLVNERRRRAGCGPLSLDRRLTDAATEHAVDMASHGYFAHASRNGDDPGDRVRDAGFRWRRYGENIARGPGSPYEVVRDWMRSPEHRDNILDCRLREMGIGLARSPRRGAYWVQDFATP